MNQTRSVADARYKRLLAMIQGLGSGGAAAEPVWIQAPMSGTYAPASARELWLLFNSATIVHVTLAADVQDGDIVVPKLTFSPDTGPTISSLAAGVEFEFPDGTFVSSVELDTPGALRWKYSAATGISGHPTAYLLW